MGFCCNAVADYAAVPEMHIPDGPDKTYILRQLRTLAMWVNAELPAILTGRPARPKENSEPPKLVGSNVHYKIASKAVQLGEVGAPDNADAIEKIQRAHVAALGVVSGVLDAIGGGGWGASTLIGWRMTTRLAIGSANAAEFFVTSVVTATFVATNGLELWPIITGLVTGGVLAAPFAAFMTRRLPERPLMFLVRTVIVLLSLRGLLQSLH